MRITARRQWLAVALALTVAACGGDAQSPASDTSVTTATTVASSEPPTDTSAPTTSTTSTTAAPTGPLVQEGDRNATVAAFQHLLNCAGYGQLVVDGVFGPATLAAVEAAQTALNKTVDGAPDDATLAELSRQCNAVRRIDVRQTSAVVGNVAPGDSESFIFAARAGTEITVAVSPPTGVTVSLRRMPEGVFESALSWQLGSTADYIIEVSHGSADTTFLGPVTFELTFDVEFGQRQGEWVLTTEGVTRAGFGSLEFGSDAETVIAQLVDWSGGLESDTGWQDVENAAVGAKYSERYVVVDGIKFGFLGDVINPDGTTFKTGETFEQVAYTGAEGQPVDILTTEDGIAIGDPASLVTDIYGDDAELRYELYGPPFYWYPGESASFGRKGLCFYFDTPRMPDGTVNEDGALYERPTPSTPIVALANPTRWGVFSTNCETGAD